VPGNATISPITVTNTGNFSDQVRFMAGSARVNAPHTVSRAVIDVDGSSTINAGDTDITSGGLSAAIAQNGNIHVLVEVTVSNTALPGQLVTATLGDAPGASPWDNLAANSSALEVRTESALSVNGKREAKGEFSATVVDDAKLLLRLNAPTGPVAIGSDITYSDYLSWRLRGCKQSKGCRGSPPRAVRHAK